MRLANIERKSSETDISVEINLDGTGKSDIDTGIGFLDHMLNLLAFHGGFDLKVKCLGDTYVDDHHTVEDVGICLGQGFYKAIGDRKGIKRYSNVSIPMDEALCTTTIDISNRPYCVFNMDFQSERLGDMSTQNFEEFFKSFAFNARLTLHINLLYGHNDHHKIEAAFKAFGRALKDACKIVSKEIPSTKGIL